MKSPELLFLLIFCMLCKISWAQNDADNHSQDSIVLMEYTPYSISTATEPDYIPARTSYTSVSPDANLMIRNISTSADKYNGILNVSIPIYNMDLNSTTISINLNYCATGIRVDDIASTVGLGWRLSAGGKITRVIQGEPDNFSNLQTTSNIYSWTSANAEKWLKESYDSQHDMYYFEMPGYSGSFVCDNSNIAHTIPYQNLKIERTSDNNFKIYDEQGTCYLFATSECTCETPQNTEKSISYQSSWYLDTIEFMNGDSVDFRYITGDDYSYQNKNYQTVIDIFTNPPYQIVPRASYSHEVITKISIQSPKYLSQIRYKDQQIDFDYDSKRPDIINYMKLNTISVHADTPGISTSPIRTFNFQYERFISNRGLKLTGVEEQDANTSNTRPLCSFEYYEDENLPARGYYGIDHWGYCNTNDANPYKYPHFTLESEIDPTMQPLYLMINVASREPVLKYTRAFSLKKVLYPNGGVKEFVYELHRTSAQKEAGGLRIKKIIEKSSNISPESIYEYTYEGGILYNDFNNYLLYNDWADIRTKDVTEIRHRFALSAKNLTSSVDYFGSSVIYSAVTEILPNGSSVKYVYSSLREYPDLEAQKYKASSSSVIRLGADNKGKIPKTTRSWGRYMLKCKISYDAANNMVDSMTYLYKIDSSKMVKIPEHYAYDLQKAIEYDKSSDKTVDYIIGEYFSVSCPVYLQKQIVHKGKYNLPQTVEYDYNGFGQLAHLYRTDYDGITINTKYRYPQDFSSTDAATVIGKLKSRNCRIPIEEITSKYGKIYDAVGRTFRFNENNPDAVVLDCEKKMELKSPIDQWDFAPVALSADKLVFNSYYKDLRRYLDYNASGQLLCYEDETGMRHSFVYGNTTCPVMTVHNARHSENPSYNEVYFNDFEAMTGAPYKDAKSGKMYHVSTPNATFTIDKKLKPGTYDVIFWHDGNGPSLPWERRAMSLKITSASTYPSVSFGITGLIDDLCIVPRNAAFSTCEYVPGWGNVSETTEQGSYFKTDYNGLGLPVQVKDMYNTIVKKFEYR